LINKISPFYIALFVSIVFIIIFTILSAAGVIQSSDTLHLIGQASRWCETVSGGLFREPLNTWSNLGFMISGLLIFWIISKEDVRSNNLFRGLTPISMLYASVVIFLGPGSMLMHGTNSEWGGWADNLSMIMFISLPWLYNVYSMSSWSINTFLKTYASIIIIYSIWRWFSDWGLGINFDLFFCFYWIMGNIRNTL
jgi:hypothetical protein